MAIRVVAERSPAQLTSEWAKLPETGRVRALAALAETKRPSPVFQTALGDSSAAVRVAALDALGEVGDPSFVMTVAVLAAKEGDQQIAARSCLASMPGKEVDARIVSELANAEPKVRLELIRAAGERGSAGASPLLLKLASDPDPEVRRESARGLRQTATPREVSGLATLVATPPSPGERAELGRSLSAAVRRGGPEGAETVVKVYQATADPAARAALLATLAGHAQSLPVVRSALNASEPPEVTRAAILALSDWPDATPVPDLLDVARNGSSPAHQVLALRGAIKLIGQPAASRSPQESVKMLAQAAALAKQPEEKRALLALAPRYPVPESLELARKFLDDPQVATEARAAVTRLERTVKR
jgi:HEAT repeat protein